MSQPFFRLAKLIFYGTQKNDHGLPHDPYKSCVIPRPIGWITSISITGILNLAPFSQFNNLGYDPPYVMFSAGTQPNGNPKDSTKNAKDTGEFVCNMATWELRNAVSITSQTVSPEVNEANQEIPTVLFGRRRNEFLEAFPEFNILEHSKIAIATYLLSGRFRSWTLLPQRLHPYFFASKDVSINSWVF